MAEAVFAMATTGGVDTTTTHIASHDVHVNDEERRIVMYFHGLDAFAKQATRVAVSENGVDFTTYPDTLGRSYFRASDTGVQSMRWPCRGNFIAPKMAMRTSKLGR
jgi:hypothetical protein